MSATFETVSHIVSWLIVYLILVDSCRMFGDNDGFVLKHVPYSEIRGMGERGSWIHDRASATESMIGDVRESSIGGRLSTSSRIHELESRCSTCAFVDAHQIR